MRSTKSAGPKDLSVLKMYGTVARVEETDGVLGLEFLEPQEVEVVRVVQRPQNGKWPIGKRLIIDKRTTSARLISADKVEYVLIDGLGTTILGELKS